jgi:hypothetical protein
MVNAWSTHGLRKPCNAQHPTSHAACPSSHHCTSHHSQVSSLCGTRITHHSSINDGLLPLLPPGRAEQPAPRHALRRALRVGRQPPQAVGCAQVLPHGLHLPRRRSRRILGLVPVPQCRLRIRRHLRRSTQSALTARPRRGSTRLPQPPQGPVRGPPPRARTWMLSRTPCCARGASARPTRPSSRRSGRCQSSRRSPMTSCAAAGREAGPVGAGASAPHTSGGRRRRAPPCPLRRPAHCPRPFSTHLQQPKSSARAAAHGARPGPVGAAPRPRAWPALRPARTQPGLHRPRLLGGAVPGGPAGLCGIASGRGGRRGGGRLRLRRGRPGQAVEHAPPASLRQAQLHQPRQRLAGAGAQGQHLPGRHGQQGVGRGGPAAWSGRCCSALGGVRVSLA